MTANPLTRQILDAFAETERDNPPPPWTANLLADIGDTLMRVIPEHDPAAIGQVLMHMGAIFNTISKDDEFPADVRKSAIFGGNILIGAGGRLHKHGTTSRPPANPITDQFAAAAHSIVAAHWPDCPCPITDVPAGIVETMTADFPAVDPHLLGAIMLHCNVIAQELAIGFEADDVTAPEEVAPSAMNLVMIAAANLYTGTGDTQAKKG